MSIEDVREIKSENITVINCNIISTTIIVFGQEVELYLSFDKKDKLDEIQLQNFYDSKNEKEMIALSNKILESIIKEYGTYSEKTYDENIKTTEYIWNFKEDRKLYLKVQNIIPDAPSLGASILVNYSMKKCNA